MMDFSGSAGKESKGSLMPNGTLAWVYIHVRETKISSKTGTRYMDLELTIAEGHPFTGRKVFTNLMDPMYEGNSESAQQMGQIAICRILECNGAGPNNPQAYQLPQIEMINNMKAAVKIKLIPAKDGYDEKNEIAEWLTPNPASKSCQKPWAALLKGEYVPQAAGAQHASAAGGFPAPSAQPSMFPANPQPTAGFPQPSAGVPAAGTPQGAFSQPAGGAPSGFPQLQPGGQPAGFTQPQAGGFAPTAGTHGQPAVATSPSNGAAPWLAQANRP